MDFCIFLQRFPQNFGRSHIFIACFSNILSVFVAGGEMLHEICHALLWKCLGPQFLICFYYPVNIYNVGGFALPCYYCAQEANKEKLNIAFQYLKTKHMDFFRKN